MTRTLSMHQPLRSIQQTTAKQRTFLAFVAGALVVGLSTPVVRADQSPTSLTFVAVGISRYNGGERNLKWAAKDARDLSAVLKAQQGKLFAAVQGITLTDEQATAVNIRQALTWANSKASIQSLTLIYFAGHGGVGLLGSYGIPAYDYTKLRPRETEITWSELRAALEGMSGRVLLILDTCHAAQGANNNTPASPLAVASGFRNNVITFAASMADQVSDEKDHLKNGVFTYALIEALSGKADANGDGIITLAEVDAYVADRVEKLSNGKQQTAMERPATVRSNLPLARMQLNPTLAASAPQGGGISGLIQGLPGTAPVTANTSGAAPVSTNPAWYTPGSPRTR
jgi:uncharacterized caspase-like protein